MRKRNEKRTDLIVNLGRNIAQLRRNAGMSQEELASEINITTATLSRIECGVTDTTVSMLGNISKALDVKVSFLFAGAEVMPIGLPHELEEIIRLLKSQKYSTISAALKQIEALVAMVEKQK